MRRGRRAGAVTGDDPLAVLLLPAPLERFAERERAEELLRSPRAVAIEPPRVPWRALAALPDLLRDAVAAGQAQRLTLPGRPRVVVLWEPDALALARALLARFPGAELWYAASSGAGGGRGSRRRAERDAEAAARAARTFAAGDPGAAGPAAGELWNELGALDLAGPATGPGARPAAP